MRTIVWTIAALYAAPLIIGAFARLVAKAYRGEAGGEALALVSLVIIGIALNWLHNRRERRRAGR